MFLMKLLMKPCFMLNYTYIYEENVKRDKNFPDMLSSQPIILRLIYLYISSKSE